MGNVELRSAVEELLDVDRERSEADAREARLVSYLAHHYRALDADDPLRHPVAGESFEVIAGEGTPEVSDFLMLELAAARGITGQAAASLVIDVLNIEYRHPLLWAALLDAAVPLWVARRVATKCSHLSQAAAQWVDARWTRRQPGLPVSRKLKILDGLIVEADPAVAAEQVARMRRGRYVHVGRYMDGCVQVVAQVDVLAGAFVDAQVDRLADIMLAEGAVGTKPELRATALGILATPARALAMLQRAAQPSLDEAADTLHSDPTQEPPDEMSDDLTAVESGVCPAGRGHLCGAVSVSPDSLLPKVDLVVHVSARGGRDYSPSALGTVDGILTRLIGPAARLDGMGEYPTQNLGDLLTGVRVVVRPVIDLNDTPSVDRYEIPRRTRFATTTRHTYDVFPFSGRRAATLDLDHTIPWHRHGPPGQTAVDNLAPMSRRAHRAKTCGAWTLTRGPDGRMEWESPLGFRYEVTPVGSFACRAGPR